MQQFQRLWMRRTLQYIHHHEIPDPVLSRNFLVVRLNFQGFNPPFSITKKKQTITGSTISTLLHDKINPKDCQVLSLGDSRSLQFFRVETQVMKWQTPNHQHYSKGIAQVHKKINVHSDWSKKVTSAVARWLWSIAVLSCTCRQSYRVITIHRRSNLITLPMCSWVCVLRMKYYPLIKL